KVDTIWMAADTLFTKLIFLRDLVPLDATKAKTDEALVEEDAVMIERQGEIEVTASQGISVTAPAEAEMQDSAAVQPEPVKHKRRIFGLLKPKPQTVKEPVKRPEKTIEPALPDSITALAQSDSTALADSLKTATALNTPLDTTRTRILL